MTIRPAGVVEFKLCHRARPTAIGPRCWRPRMAQGRLASPFTARRLRNDWTGLTEPRVVGEALESLREVGWIRSETVVAPDGGVIPGYFDVALRDTPPRRG
jgi:hypothetical protein